MFNVGLKQNAKHFWKQCAQMGYRPTIVILCFSNVQRDFLKHYKQMFEHGLELSANHSLDWGMKPEPTWLHAPGVTLVTLAA